MKPRRFLLCLLLASLFGFAADASARVRWRVSIKIFTDDNGNRPSGTTDTAMRTLIADYNFRLQAFARGLELELAEIVELDPSLSNWYNRAARDSANRQELQAIATVSPDLYAYRANSINVYINNTSSGICCGAGNGLVFMGNPSATSSTMFHEIGHFMGLNHTQGEGCNGCCPDALGCCDTPATDHVSDTIIDVACWNRDEIATANYGANDANITAGQRAQVDDVWFNLMSYHQNDLPGLRLTQGQIDRAGGVSNTERDNIAANYFRFVDNTVGNDINLGLSPLLPLRTLTAAVNTAGTSDAIAFSAGTYTRASSSAYRITKACLLTSRGGNVRLRQVAP
jgi:hypothetical protein